MIVEVQVPVHPTESTEQVQDCFQHLFPSMNPVIKELDDSLQLYAESSQTSSIEWMRSRIREIRIIDAVRQRLLSNWNGSETSILLDKQAACSSRFRLLDDTEESPPLGCIQVVIRFESEIEFQNTMKWLVPPTKNGRVIDS
ncbi:hypothetical protein EU519_00400 [Candidatus Thorarchaeota archaeon]|nr:MAG: hypothetical protein EU519_00400 [Candidatus Thorarchaeota archaeon]